MSGSVTPLPWSAETTETMERTFRPWIGRLAEGRYSAMSCGETRAEAEANAAFIVRACNSHADLLEALLTKRDYIADAASGALTYPDSGEGFKLMAAEDLARIDAAIAKATTPLLMGEGE